MYDENIYNTYTMNNINLDEFHKNLDDFVTTHDKKIRFLLHSL